MQVTLKLFAAAREAAGPDGVVLPVFVFDDRLWRPSGNPRRRFLLDCLEDLREQTGGALVLRHGDPQQVIPKLVGETGTTTVHISAGAYDYRDPGLQIVGEVPVVLIAVRTGHP